MAQKQDNREALRAAVARKAERKDSADKARHGRDRAQEALRNAQIEVIRAQQALDEAKGKHAEEMAGAFASGSDAAIDRRAVKKAREALEDAEDRRDAAQTALDKLQADLDEAEQRLLYTDLQPAIYAAMQPLFARVFTEAVAAHRRVIKLRAVLELLRGRGLLTGDGSIDLYAFMGNANVRMYQGALLPEFEGELDVSDWIGFLKQLETNPDAEPPAI